MRQDHVRAQHRCAPFRQDVSRRKLRTCNLRTCQLANSITLFLSTTIRFDRKAFSSMDYIWTPWRYQYMKQAESNNLPECIFCDAINRHDDHETLVGDLGSADPEALSEMMQLAQRVEGAFRANYKPDGMNVGMNIGRAGGAGVVGHIHLHVLPRWFGDSNFMTVVGETRVLPEDLNTTYTRLREYLNVGSGEAK